MGKELYERLHPDLTEKLPEFTWFLNDSYLTRENVARCRAESLTGAIAQLEAAEKTNPLFQQVTIRKETIAGLTPDIRFDVYIIAPKGAREPLPGYLGIHGGGMIVGSCQSEQLAFMEFAARVNCVVISPDYRLAPEHPYPAGPDDCYAAALWMEKNAERLGIDKSRMAVGGTSAGGNLAVSTALRARDLKGPKFIAMYVGSPMLDCRNNTPSAVEIQERSFCWDYVQNGYAWEMYLQGLSPVPYYASPALAGDLSGLPPTVMYSNELDPFRDETLRFAAGLLQCRVSTELHIFPGVFHGGDLVGKGTPIGDRLDAFTFDIMHRLLHLGKF